MYTNILGSFNYTGLRSLETSTFMTRVTIKKKKKKRDLTLHCSQS